MSEKVLSREELEVTQRMQLHFPFGFIPKQILKNWKGAPKAQLEKIMFHFVAHQAFRSPIITVPLTFEEGLTYEEMVRRGNYTRNDARDEVLKMVDEKPAFKNCRASLLPAVTEWEGAGLAVQNIRLAGFREATVWELLALGYQYPTFQMNGPIVALGTNVQGDVPRLGDFLNQRTFDLMSTSPGCGYRGCYLAIAE